MKQIQVTDILNLEGIGEKEKKELLEIWLMTQANMHLVKSHKPKRKWWQFWK